MEAEEIRVLLVEDNPGDIRLIREYLADASVIQVSIDQCDRLASALEHVASNGVDAVLLDLALPDSSGIETFLHFRLAAPQLPIVVLTGLNDAEVALSALQAGAQDYLVKGKIDSDSLARAIRYAIERQRTAEALRKSLNGTIRAFARAVEMRDPYTAGHQVRVAQLAVAIAVRMGLARDRVAGIDAAGLLHDIGKLAIPAEILSKPTRLTDIEFALVKSHSQSAADLLRGIDFPWPLADFVLQHHERIDGSGYPQGLTGDEMHLEAKILAVADVVEAMSSHRPYRPALGIDKAIEEVSRNREVLFDPMVVDACIQLFQRKGFKFSR